MISGCTGASVSALNLLPPLAHRSRGQLRHFQHEEHAGMLEWIGGKFDPEKFSPAAATKEMSRGLPNWRDYR
jgi:hypothetical protein